MRKLNTHEFVSKPLQNYEEKNIDGLRKTFHSENDSSKLMGFLCFSLNQFASS